MRGLILGVVLVVAVASPTYAQAPIHHDASADSAQVRYAGIVIFRQLAPALAEAAQDTTRHWWRVQLPTSRVPRLWENLRGHLVKALHARDSVATDSTMGYVVVGDPRLDGNVMTFTVTIGTGQRCGGSWRGNDQDYFVRTERSGGTWMWPTVSQGGHGYSASCW